METGDIIKKLRNEKKITQSELGVMLGVNTSSIQKYESGATRNLKLETIRELCHIFDVPPVAFVFPETQDKNVKRPPLDIESTLYYFREVLQINEAGAKKVLDYIEDIRSMDKYRSSR